MFAGDRTEINMFAGDRTEINMFAGDWTEIKCVCWRSDGDQICLLEIGQRSNYVCWKSDRDQVCIHLKSFFVQTMSRTVTDYGLQTAQTDCSCICTTYGSISSVCSSGQPSVHLAQQESFNTRHYLQTLRHPRAITVDFVHVSTILFMFLPFCSCFYHFVHVSAILFMFLPFCSCFYHFVYVFIIFFMFLPFCSCFCHFVHVSAILFMFLPFCLCFYHFVYVSTIFFMFLLFCSCFCHFLHVSAIFSGFDHNSKILIALI